MRLLSFILAGICLAATTTAAFGQDSSVGLDVGQKAAPIEAKDQNGETVTLSSLLKESNVALVFYRSASW